MNKSSSLAILFLLSWLNLSAQTDSVSRLEPRKLFTTQAREQLQKLRFGKPDSVKLPDGIDSLRKLSQNFTDSLPVANANNKVKQEIDSLSITINGVNQKISGVQGKIDGIDDGIHETLNKANDKVVSIENGAQHKVDSLQDKINSSVSSVEGTIESKIKEITGENVDIPVADKLNLSSGESIKTSLPNSDLPNISDLKIDVPNTEQLNIGLPDLKDKLPSTDQLSPAKLEQVENLTEHVQEIDGKLAEVEKYESEFQNIKDGAPEKLEKLPEEVEKRLSEVSEVNALKGEAAKATAQQAQYEAMIKKYQDKKLLEAEIKRKAATVANDYMAEHAGKVQEAQKQLDKTKRGLAGVKSVRDVFKKRSNELDNKKFYQRLVPGITWQWYKKDFVSVDFALQMGYRLTPRLNTGIGWIYRTGFSKEFDYYVKGLQTYGGRAYLDFAIAKGLFAHGDFEMMKLGGAAVPNPNNLTANENLVPRTYGSYFGLGKRFNISRNFRGNVQGLYRVDYQGSAPTVDKITARFGVEYIFRKTKRKFNGLKK